MQRHGTPHMSEGRPVAPRHDAEREAPLDRLLRRARSRLARLQPHEVVEAVQGGGIVVDIRPEFQRHRDGEIPGAIIVERNHLEWRLHPESSGRIAEATDVHPHWIVICDEGYASSLAAATLQMIGLHRATDVAGGLQAWRAAGLPVTHPPTPTAPRLAPAASAPAPGDEVERPVGA